MGTYNDLLKSLALAGDASAFFSMCESYFQARYHKERNSNVSHEDATTRLIAEASDLFEQLTHLQPNHFDAWFEEHCTMHQTTNNEPEEYILEKKTISESNRFIAQCAQELIRTGSKLKKKRQARVLSFPQTLLKRRLLLTLGLPLLLGLVIACGLLILNLSNTNITITITSSTSSHSFRLPPKKASDSTLINFISSRKDSLVPRTDSLKKVNDTTVHHADKNTISPVVAPKKNPSVLSPTAPAVERRIAAPAAVRPIANNPSPPAASVPTSAPLPPAAPPPQPRTEDQPLPSPTIESPASAPTPSTTGSSSETENTTY